MKTQVVSGTLHTRILYKGKPIHTESSTRELHPGRWIVDEFITLPGDGSTYHLNRSAVAVWERCDGRTTTREIATALARDYEVAFDEALNDVEELVMWLAESSLLRDPPAP